MTEESGVVVPLVEGVPPDAAVAYAEAEAGRRGCALQQVPVRRPIPRFLGGSLVGRLVALSRRAAVLVVPAELPGADAVTARAVSPVVTVPAGWSDRQPAEDDVPVVVVGVRDIADSADLLGTAFDAARGLGAVLHAVHVWEAGVTMPPRPPGAMDGAHRDLERVVADVAAEHPGVPYAAMVLPGVPAAVLRSTSEGADLLVVGRLRARTPAGSLLGSTARAMLAGSAIPVMVVHVTRTFAPWPDGPAYDVPGTKASVAAGRSGLG